MIIYFMKNKTICMKISSGTSLLSLMLFASLPIRAMNPETQEQPVNRSASPEKEESSGLILTDRARQWGIFASTFPAWQEFRVKHGEAIKDKARLVEAKKQEEAEKLKFDQDRASNDADSSKYGQAQGHHRWMQFVETMSWEEFHKAFEALRDQVEASQGRSPVNLWGNPEGSREDLHRFFAARDLAIEQALNEKDKEAALSRAATGPQPEKASERELAQTRAENKKLRSRNEELESRNKELEQLLKEAQKVRQ